MISHETIGEDFKRTLVINIVEYPHHLKLISMRPKYGLSIIASHDDVIIRIRIKISFSCQYVASLS